VGEPDRPLKMRAGGVAMTDIEHLRTWIGRQEIVNDEIPAFPADALAATLDQEEAPQGGLPPLWHWIYFHNAYRQSDIAEDGHVKRGAFVPPVPLPRRMFAGGQYEFHRPIRFRQFATRQSTIEDLVFKRGRSGQLAFLKIKVDISDRDGIAMTEHQDIVYCEILKSRPAEPVVEPARVAEWRDVVTPTSSLLFRYSALIFSAHKIHLDREYTVGHEGYSGLVVHGQLVATMLAELARKHVPGQMRRFWFRAIRPVLDDGPFAICGARDGGTVHLWAENSTGHVAMEAQALYD
jgi:3-methylfumaryl-CoA hydratase